MARLPLLTDIIKELGPEIDIARRSRELLLSSSDEQRATGWLLRAAAFYQDHSPDGALGALIESRRRMGFYTLAVMANILWLARESQTRQTAAYQCVRFADDALEHRYDHLAVEAYAAALLLDGHAKLELLGDPAALKAIAAAYEQIAARNRPAERGDPLGGRVREADGPTSVVLLAPNLVDDIVAYTQTVLHFARHHDRERFRLQVLVTESSSVRGKSYFPFGCTGGVTGETGAGTLRELESLGVPVQCAPRDPAFIDGARQVEQMLRAVNPDILLALTGMACPIDWLAIRWAAIPVKAAIHIGSSLFMRGLDATFYDNPANILREDRAWETPFGKRLEAPLGIEIDRVERSTPAPRTRWGIPADALVMGVLSNHLDKRLSPEFLRGIAATLSRQPNAWFLALGREPPPSIVGSTTFDEVRHRLVFGGIPPDKIAALKALDIYVNEFPVGGSTSVMEAAAAGLPVLAMRAGKSHAACAGAEIVGPGLAIESYDPRAYFERLERWIASSAERREAARLLRERAHERYDAARCIRAILDQAESIRREKKAS